MNLQIKSFVVQRLEADADEEQKITNFVWYSTRILIDSFFVWSFIKWFDNGTNHRDATFIW